MKCEDCKFSFDDGEGGEEDPIDCRRFPPVFLPAYAGHPELFCFPSVERYEWCGEFKPKDTEAA